ncbi:YfhO family protein [Parabacteroides sp. OttesenSCG-928-N08]|nr:YfhO family protein [Parabacteroides sp. OttesenSCG-928-N08]
MQKHLKIWGKHLAALLVFFVLCFGFFSPSFIDGKTLRQGDDEKASGFGKSQMQQYEETAEPGEFSVWSDAMFGGMPYVVGYGDPAPTLPKFTLIETVTKSIGYYDAAIVFTGLICFYILMCVLGVNWWLAIAGSIAFAFASYNMIILVAGHVTKGYVMAYMPLTIAGMALLFRRKYYWGAILFLLGVALSLANSHIQITYYLTLFCFILYLGYLVAKIKAKELGELGKVTAIMVACVVLAVMPNVKALYSNWDLGKHSTRGPTELTAAATDGEKKSTGLDIDYAFEWSYGKSELLTFLIPNVYGGGSSTKVDNSSEFARFLRGAGYQVGNDIKAPTYWGDKLFTEGPVYVGAVICFLFLFGMFIIRSRMKWWLLAATLFLTVLALGRNLELINTFLFHYFPLMNKFRTVEMALVLPGMALPLIALWGLKELLSNEIDAKQLQKGLIWSLAISGGLCLIVWLLPTAILSFQSEYDVLNGYNSQPWYRALIEDRKSMASSDAFRSLLFVILTAGLLFFYSKAKDKNKVALIVSAGMLVLIVADLLPVAKRHLNESHFVAQKRNAIFTPSVADKEIFKDSSSTYRVMNLNNPFQETQTSYFHHSVGGYYAAKMRRYQELIDHKLNEELKQIIGSFQSATSLFDIQDVFRKTPALNMLNTKYIIFNPEQPPVTNPYAFGNAWFVDEVKLVENADAEIAAIKEIDPLTTAVIDKRFADQVAGFSAQPDSMARITLEKYRPNKLTYSYQSAKEQIAIFSEIYYYPGWEAYIDGQPVPHFRADWTLRGMRIPAGQHEIVFEFRPQAYITAAYVSNISSFLILLLFIGAIGYAGWKGLSLSTSKHKGEKE